MNFIPIEHLPEVTARVEELRAELQALLHKKVVVHIDLGELVYPEELIKDYVLKTFSVTWDDLTGPSRKEVIVDARHCYCFLVRRYLKTPYTELANRLNRDHSSIIHATIRISANIQFNDVRIMHVIKGFEALYREFVPKTGSDES